MQQDSSFYGTEKIGKILLKLAPPVMIAQLIQALYNVVDSFFVGQYAQTGLTALSIIYPIQLLMIAFAVGTGVGINTCMSYFAGLKKEDKVKESAGMAVPLGLMMWITFAIITFFAMPAYARLSTDSEEVIREVIVYGRITCVGSIGVFMESNWTKVLQADGDMKTPMIAQVIGALTNIVMDPILIFGLVGFRELGIAGAAIATVAGQIVAALIVMPKGCRRPPDVRVYLSAAKKIYYMGIPNILMQSAYTVYIFGLNMILATFSDQAVTTLGLYYKWQSFFFIPLGAMQTCIVPVISYNFAAKRIDRCKQTMTAAIGSGMALMLIGVACFELIPGQMLSVFTSDPEVISIGTNAFHIIGIGFIPMVTTLIFPVFFQAVGSAVKSSLLTIVRTVVLFVPLGYLFSRFGLQWFWLTFPVTECLTTTLGLILYHRFLQNYAYRTGAY